MAFPNFLILGAAKSGTSALFHFLRQHPSVYMSPIKEPHFFGYEDSPPNSQGPGDFVNTAITDLETYLSLFAKVQNETAIGEASPTYLYLPRACERIHHHIPDVRLIAILRHPADRAYSAYMHVVRDGRETESNFCRALKLEPERIQANWGPIWHFTHAGYYHRQLRPFFNRFNRDQIKVYLYEDLKADPLALLQDIFRFLGVDIGYKPDIRLRPNVSGLKKYTVIDSATKSLFERPNPIRFISRRLLPDELRWRFTSYVRNLNLVPQSIDPDIYMMLTEMYQPDILKLQELIRRDLSHWLEVNSSGYSDSQF